MKVISGWNKNHPIQNCYSLFLTHTTYIKIIQSKIVIHYFWHIPHTFCLKRIEETWLIGKAILFLSQAKWYSDLLLWELWIFGRGWLICVSMGPHHACMNKTDTNQQKQTDRERGREREREREREIERERESNILFVCAPLKRGST